jgi:hypothetical protein
MMTLAQATTLERGDGIYQVVTPIACEKLLTHLAYWETCETNTPQYSIQVRREATTNVVRNGIPTEELRDLLPFQERKPVPLGNRRCLRYGSHGIHEYRGKFFPQLVTALINWTGVKDKGVVADPMCGSGTTMVEAGLHGATGLGLDMNPLSVFMATVKCDVLRLSPAKLDRAYKTVRRALLNYDERRNNEMRYFRSLPEIDQLYLRRWFSQRTLENLDAISRAIERNTDGVIRNFFRVALSNVLRPVSWQKESDLRIRKEIKSDGELDPVRSFLEELGRSVRLVLAFLYENDGTSLGTTHVSEGDARNCAITWMKWVGKVDAIITSPPYATALPYLDTDRLSLSYLNLLPRAAQRCRDFAMIGNREISEKVRRELWAQFQKCRHSLPGSVSALVNRVHTLNECADVGFRRKNLSALLGKYFLDMEKVLRGMRVLLRPGGKANIVVGSNSTTAGGEQVDIKTADLIAEMADAAGLTPLEHVHMEMLVPRDIFKANAIPTEQILRFQKAGALRAKD